MNISELESWKITAIILGIIAIVIFTVQRSSYMFLDPVFELCIFYIPTMMSVVVYFYLRKKLVVSTIPT
ncbi:hypothetical protein A3K78_01410 [Candidatus Bathyarchaeota archaeon RBG_13_52_12]|nr:MAG: hypothetical protein A3K78_01410 [Candidatus Bathyarchaeota archaeon RBG_13_52_12]